MTECTHTVPLICPAKNRLQRLSVKLSLPASQMTDMMVKEMCEGVEGSGVRCGVIGEVGVSWPMTEFEKKSLKASALAQQQTGEHHHILYVQDACLPVHVCIELCVYM